MGAMWLLRRSEPLCSLFCQRRLSGFRNTGVPELGWELLSDPEKGEILAGMASGGSTLPPRTIQIDWTDRCNVDCFFCSQAEIRKGGGELAAEVLERCFAEMDALGVRTLNVAGGGDPLFHRQIGAILESVRSHGFRIGTITTNGVLARGHIAELLLDVVREQISISLNSLGADDYATVMQTTPRNYDRVLENVRRLVSERSSRGASGPVIALQFLVHDGTSGQLPRMFELARELGVDRVAFNPLFSFDSRSRRLVAKPDEFLADVAALFRDDREGMIADVRTIDPRLNARIARLRLDAAPDRYPTSAVQKRNFDALQSFCALPWFNFHVKANGAVYPCCALLFPGFRPFGNVLEQSIREIWEGDAYRRFRQSHAGFTKAVREDDSRSQRSSDLPKPCTVHGMCFLRALPYLDDTPFAVAVDPQEQVTFPGALRDREWAKVSVPNAETFRGVPADLFVNRLHCGRLVRAGHALEFAFQPEPLGPGFHLLEVRVEDKVVAARMVEKLAALARPLAESALPTPIDPRGDTGLLPSLRVERVALSRVAALEPAAKPRPAVAGRAVRERIRGDESL